ncbi:hypothetical protein GON26_04080 [Flavobacterium sp. GA093]|uniref:Uncharacterized protein n=1 Tax=Flavobacterium hydrocarbonoxydans TaxID=2683249 RepID=A0A6I4NLR7_9FLAO|nr:hypothetical protein [Flavobacterium hydrocarbonoxydans]MWB93525.1 hypothetical protein [Flavobacterium hydrocarbonoxydans]
MAKVLKFKDVNSNVESRMKEFEKLRSKLKAEKAKKLNGGKDNKGIFKSISEFFSDTPAQPKKPAAK